MPSDPVTSHVIGSPIRSPSRALRAAKPPPKVGVTPAGHVPAPAAGAGVGEGGTDVAVGGTGVAVAAVVAVGGTLVLVGVGGTGVEVGPRARDTAVALG